MSIKSEVVARCVQPTCYAAMAVPIRFTYDPSAPLEVVATFTDQGDSCTWTLGRDLLADALECDATGRAGVGDVQAWTTGKNLTLQLQGFDDDWSPASAQFTMRARTVAQFLARTAQLVPYGQERVDVDRGLMALLGGTA